MTVYPNPTHAQMRHSLDLHDGNLDRALDYLCLWVGAYHPAVCGHIQRRLTDYAEGTATP